MGLLDGKFGIVFGVANKRSIAWAIAQAWARAGATLAFTYQGQRLKENVEELAAAFGRREESGEAPPPAGLSDDAKRRLREAIARKGQGDSP